MARRRNRRSLGKVDLFGLNAFGSNPGMDALYGVAIGGATAGVTTLALEHSGNATAMKYSDAIGFGVGMATAVGMWTKKSMRHAAYGAAAGAFFASGLSWVKSMLSSAPQAAAIDAAADPSKSAAATNTAAASGGTVAGLGIHQLRQLNGLGIHQIRQLNGHQITNVSRPAGVAGPTLGSRPPVQLYGRQSRNAKLMGMPATSGVASLYGATTFGAR